MCNFFKNLANKEILIFFLVVFFIFFLSCFFFGESISNVINLINNYPRVAPENGVLINQQDSYIIHLGYLGSFLQGSIGLIVSIVIMFTVFITFSIERKRVNTQRLEDRFYHLLMMHNENVKSMNIDYNGGRLENSKAILNIFRELEVIVKILKIKVFMENKIKKIFQLSFSERENSLLSIMFSYEGDYKIFKKNKEICSRANSIIYEVSFLIMFIGCGERSSKILKNYLLKFDDILDSEQVIKMFSDENFRDKIKENYKFKYKLFGGHQSRLGHYYRNMFHVVKFIDSNSNLFFEEKVSYIKNFRVQLNTFEQALLMVNCKSDFGKDWEGYIVKYKLVKNIPKDFFGSDYWFDLESEVRKIATEYKAFIKKECKQDVNSFMISYFEFSKHGLK